MDTEIIVAIIGAAAVIVAAIIGIWNKKEKTSNKNIHIKQKTSGKNNTQIGIQINKKESDSDVGNSKHFAKHNNGKQ